MAYTEVFNSKLDWMAAFQRQGSFPLDRSSIFKSYASAYVYASQGTLTFADLDSKDEFKNVTDAEYWKAYTDAQVTALGTCAYVGQVITVYGPGPKVAVLDSEGVETSTTFPDEVTAYVITGVGATPALMKLAQTTTSGDFASDINNLQTQITALSGRLTTLERDVAKLPTQDTNTTYSIATSTFQPTMEDLAFAGGKINLIGSDNTNVTAQVSGWQNLVTQVENVTAVASGKSTAYVYQNPQIIEFQLDAADPNKFKVGDIIYFKDLYIPDYWVTEVLTEVDPETNYYYKFSDLEVTKIDLTKYLEISVAANLYATKEDVREKASIKDVEEVTDGLTQHISSADKKFGNVKTNSEGKYIDLQSQIGDIKTYANGTAISLQSQILSLEKNATNNLNLAISGLKTELSTDRFGSEANKSDKYISSIQQINGKIVAEWENVKDYTSDIETAAAGALDDAKAYTNNKIGELDGSDDTTVTQYIADRIGDIEETTVAESIKKVADKLGTGEAGDEGIITRVATLENTVTSTTNTNSHATRISALETAIGTNSTTGSTISSRLKTVEGTVKTQGETILDHSTRIGNLEESVQTLTETTIPNLQNNVNSRVKEIQINSIKQTMTADGVVNITEITTDVLKQGNNILLLDCLNAALTSTN